MHFNHIHVPDYKTSNAIKPDYYYDIAPMYHQKNMYLDSIRFMKALEHDLTAQHGKTGIFISNEFDNYKKGCCDFGCTVTYLDDGKYYYKAYFPDKEILFKTKLNPEELVKYGKQDTISLIPGLYDIYLGYHFFNVLDIIDEPALTKVIDIDLNKN